MPPLPAVTGPELIKALQKVGFELKRTSGSHHVMRHPDGRGTSVQVHGNRNLPVGTLRSIIRQAGLTVEELLNLL